MAPRSASTWEKCDVLLRPCGVQPKLGKGRSGADLDPHALPQARPQHLAPEKRTGRSVGGSGSLGSNLPMAACSLGTMGCPLEVDGALEESEHQPTGTGFIKNKVRGVPGGAVAKIPRSQCRGPGLDPWSGD